MYKITNKPVLALAFAEYMRNPVKNPEACTVGLTEVDYDTAQQFKEEFDGQGPYHFAKRLGVLVNNSGADMAVEFMGFWNDNFYVAY